MRPFESCSFLRAKERLTSNGNAALGQWFKNRAENLTRDNGAAPLLSTIRRAHTESNLMTIGLAKSFDWLHSAYKVSLCSFVFVPIKMLWRKNPAWMFYASWMGIFLMAMCGFYLSHRKINGKIKVVRLERVCYVCCWCLLGEIDRVSRFIRSVSSAIIIKFYAHGVWMRHLY